jgi:hypothetical protein
MTKDEAQHVYRNMPHNWQRGIAKLASPDNPDPGNTDEWQAWCSVFGSPHAVFTDYQKTLSWLAYLSDGINRSG